MARSLGIKVPSRDAESTRRRLQAAGVLRKDLKVSSDGDAVVFPVADDLDGTATEFDFEARTVAPRDYTELLPAEMRTEAPRAHDILGDIVLVKVPRTLWGEREAIGEALLRFHGARAVFHDHGVTGEFRVRKLERIAGTGPTETQVVENGVRLHVDPAKAYYSPRLADERARVTALCRPREDVLDLFGGVAPQGVQLAKLGCRVTSVDLNPAACDLANKNGLANKVELRVVEGDARDVAPRLGPVDRVIMNLPHAAKDFLDVAVPSVRSGGTIHHHEILPKNQLQQREASLVVEIGAMGRTARIVNVRHVRDYSSDEAHYSFDLEIR